MDTSLLQTFSEVVRQGNFASAARVLYADPSAVTRSIAALERELGVRLFERTTRRLALTAPGAAYHENIHGLLDQLTRARDAARDIAGQLKGIVRIAASTVYGTRVVMPILAGLRCAHPGLQFDLLMTDARLDMVTERVDLALRVAHAEDSLLVGSQLAHLRFHVCASPGYLRRFGTPNRPIDLASHDCLRCSPAGNRTRWKFKCQLGLIEEVEVSGNVTLSNELLLHQAVLDGLGPAILPDWLVDADVSAGSLIRLLPAHQAAITQFDEAVWLLHPSREYVPIRVRAVIEFLKRHHGLPSLGHPSSTPNAVSP